jgi:hypothetical protein
MIPKCRQLIDEAAVAMGRAAPTDAQAKAIEDQISSHMRRLAREQGANWRAMARDQQVSEAAKAAIADIRAQAQRKLDNAERQVIKIAETENRVAALQESLAGTGGHTGTISEAFKADMVNVSHQMAAERKIAFGNLMSLIEAAGDKAGVGMGRKFLMLAFGAENRAMTADIVREVFRQADGSTGNKVASAAARAWLDTVEGLRTRFNAAGGDVGKLDYGWLPQPWDTAKVRNGRDAFAQFLLDKVDRTRYLREDGSLMNDQEVFDLLNASVETLATGGLNKTEPGQFKGTGARANRGGESRQIHFKDGDAWLAVMERYGSGSLYDAMMGHIGGVTRDITLVERYGPDANATARLQMDAAVRADEATPSKPVGTFEINPQTYWDMITGKTGAPADGTLARTMSTVRNLQTAAKLGAAVVSSVTDLGTLAITAGYNRLPYWQLIKDIGSQASKETRDFMSAHGMIAESVADSLNRWSGDHLGSNWSGKLANAVMRLSLLNAWTDGLRQGFTLTMNAGLARIAKTEWAALTEFDRSRLTRNGITEADWQVLNGIAPTSFKGRELLAPQSIAQSGHERANELAAKVFGFIHDESEFAVVNPDIRSRAIVTGGGMQAGTPMGEIMRTVMQFKSFPIAMITRHWARMLEGDHGADGAPLLANRALYGFAIMATTMGLGAIATQEKQILAGKDPIDMTNGRFWAKAVAQGGGFGIAGDLFLIDPSGSATDTSTTAIKNLVGPTVGTAAELVLKNITENIWQAAEGKDTHWQAELANWAKSNTPGASLWWLKPMIDHGFMNAVMESLSPGYLSRMEQRAQKDWGQRYWWKPREATPQRAPDLEAAL